MNAKISETQLKLLKEICQRPKYVADYYKPAVKLVEQGLALWLGDRNQILTPTPAGRNLVYRPAS